MQNLISLQLSAQDLMDMDAALAPLKRVFAPMIALGGRPRRRNETRAALARAAGRSLCPAGLDGCRAFMRGIRNRRPPDSQPQ